jgi:hypothetical protein
MLHHNISHCGCQCHLPFTLLQPTSSSQG